MVEEILSSVEELGYAIINELKSSSSTIVAQTVLQKDRKVIKITSKESQELAILQLIGGQDRIITLQNTQTICVENQELLLLEFPFIENFQIESNRELKAFTYQLVETMMFLHENGIYYRDFKRDNILWDGQNLTLIDFSHSMIYKDNENYPTKACVGTKGYKAPEVKDKDRTSDIRADVWSVGMVFVYEWVRFNVSPWTASHILQDTEYYELLRDMRVVFHAPRYVISLITGMLHPDPNKRLSGPSILQHNYFSSIIVKKH